jgi:hypothetical protein
LRFYKVDSLTNYNAKIDGGNNATQPTGCSKQLSYPGSLKEFVTPSNVTLPSLFWNDT